MTFPGLFARRAVEAVFQPTSRNGRVLKWGFIFKYLISISLESSPT